MSTKPKSYKELCDRVLALQTKAASATSQNGNPKGDNVTDVKDPAEKGTVTPPTHPGEAPAKQNLPPRESNGAAPEQLTDRDTKPGPTGSTPLTATDGKPKEDAATSPTAPLAKISTRVQKMAASITELMTAGAPAVKATPKEEGKEKKKEEKGETKAHEAGESAKDEANEHKEKVANDMQFTPDFHFKLAAAILSTEEGIKAATDILTKQAGAEAARQLITDAAAAQRQFNEEGALLVEQEKQAAAERAAFETWWKSASAEQRATFERTQAVHAAQIAKLESPFAKAGYAQGAADAEAMTGEMPPEADPASAQLPGAEGAPSVEEIIQILEQLVQSGQISEEEATQVVQLLSQGGGEGGAPAPEAAGGAPVEEAPEVKAASAIIDSLVPLSK